MCNQKLRGAFQMKNRIFVVLSILFQMWFFLAGCNFRWIERGHWHGYFCHDVFHSLQKLKSLSCLSGFIGRKANKSKASIFSSFPVFFTFCQQSWNLFNVPPMPVDHFPKFNLGFVNISFLIETLRFCFSSFGCNVEVVYQKIVRILKELFLFVHYQLCLFLWIFFCCWHH